MSTLSSKSANRMSTDLSTLSGLSQASDQPWKQLRKNQEIGKAIRNGTFRLNDQSGLVSVPTQMGAFAGAGSTVGRTKSGRRSRKSRRHSSGHGDGYDSDISEAFMSMRNNADDLGEEEEEETHIPWFIILPSSPVKSVWDTVVLGLLLYLVAFLPWRVAFSDADDVSWLDIVVDVLFGIDIIMSFFTAYEDKRGRVITTHSMIVKHYLRTWFVLDLIATFPFYLISRDNVTRVSSFARVPRLLKLFRLVRLLKLLRAYRFRKYFQRLEYSPSIHPGLFRIIKLFSIMLCFAHFSACMWYFVGDLREDQRDSWINRNFEKEDAPVSQKSDVSKYLISLYWSITTLTTIGYGDITARSNIELVYTTILMICGSTFFAYTTATVSSIITSMDINEARVRDKMDRLRLFLKLHDFTPEANRRVTNEMTSLYKQPSKPDHHDWSQILAEFPSHLREMVSLEMYKELIETSRFFKHFKRPDYDKFIAEIASQFVPFDVPAGEMVVTYGDPLDKWYICFSGVVQAVSSTDPDRIYMTFRKGDSFGEIPLLLAQHHKWQMSVRAKTSVLLFGVDYKVFGRILSNDLYRECLDVMRDIANRRLEELKHAKLKFTKPRASTRHLHKLQIDSQPQQMLHSIGNSSARLAANNDVMLQLLSKVNNLSTSISQIKRQLHHGSTAPASKPPPPSSAATVPPMDF
eukprot:TRINITY_DN17489_c0_g1_i1.p1 TRINITY_DN17489_c0_g1~~TRINITY_DN17489_c0_g1_i1.p1  ORF type:complete len:759 (-),score=368.03 TRINITY_DN17489_c0_g1_i1:61-2133(-)